MPTEVTREVATEVTMESTTLSLRPDPKVHPTLDAHVLTAEETEFRASLSAEHVVAKLMAAVLTDGQVETMELTAVANEDATPAHKVSPIVPMLAYELSVVA